MLAVIQVGKLNIAPLYLPAVICSDDFFCSIFVSQAQLGNQLPLISVESFVLPCCESKTGFVPAVSKQDRECSFLRKLLCHIIGLILYPLVIVIAVWGQIFLPDSFSVIKCFIQSKPADVEPCLLHLFRRCDLFFKIRMTLLCAVAGNPFSCPCFLSFAGLKILHFADYFLSCIASGFDRPVISGTWCKRYSCLITKA